MYVISRKTKDIAVIKHKGLGFVVETNSESYLNWFKGLLSAPLIERNNIIKDMRKILSKRIYKPFKWKEVKTYKRKFKYKGELKYVI